MAGKLHPAAQVSLGLQYQAGLVQMLLYKTRQTCVLSSNQSCIHCTFVVHGHAANSVFNVSNLQLTRPLSVHIVFP